MIFRVTLLGSFYLIYSLSQSNYQFVFRIRLTLSFPFLASSMSKETKSRASQNELGSISYIAVQVTKTLSNAYLTSLTGQSDLLCWDNKPPVHAPFSRLIPRGDQLVLTSSKYIYRWRYKYITVQSICTSHPDFFFLHSPILPDPTHTYIFSSRCSRYQTIGSTAYLSFNFRASFACQLNSSKFTLNVYIQRWVTTVT